MASRIWTGALLGLALAACTVDHATTTNGDPDCGTLAGCQSTQSFAGSRPPK